MSEEEVSVNPLIVDGALHLMYFIDLDGGVALANHGVVTNNPVVYHRVDIEDLNINEQALEPMQLPRPRFQFHIDPAEYFEVANETQIEPDLELTGCYPNPFNSSTQIEFSIRKHSRVELSIFDINGNVVAEIFNDNKNAGHHLAYWNADGFATGVYFVRLISENICENRKILLIK